MSDVQMQPKRRKLIAPLIVLGVLLGAVAAYFFIHISTKPAEIASFDTIYWKKLASGVEMTREAKQISVTTTPGKTDYQIEASPKLPSGMIKVHYRVRLLDGAIMIGVLSADRQKWLVSDLIADPGTNERVMEVNVPDEGTVLFTNNRKTDGQSHFIIDQMEFVRQP